MNQRVGRRYVSDFALNSYSFRTVCLHLVHTSTYDTTKRDRSVAVDVEFVMPFLLLHEQNFVILGSLRAIHGRFVRAEHRQLANLTIKVPDQHGYVLV